MSSSPARFGPIEYREEDVVHFPKGLVGLPWATRFVILSNDDEWPFSWLQCLDDPALSFVVAPLTVLFPEYFHEALAGHVSCPNQVASHAIAFLGIVVLHAGLAEMTVNLLAPIKLDLDCKTAEQLVLDGPLALLREPLAPALVALRAA